MIELPGLSGASPIGFLAALGMLRVLVEDRGHAVRLAWRNGRAVLDGLDSADAILDELIANMVGRAEAIEFTWADASRNVTPEQYRVAVECAKGDRRALGFLAGWGTDTVVAQGGFIALTNMDMTPVNKKQMLPRDLSKLVKKVNRKSLQIALLGGPYETDQSPWGLDPVSKRSGATEAKPPGKTKVPGKPGLIWLAIESIPLHPVLPVSSRYTLTVGWRYRPNQAYVWPLWSSPLTLHEVRVLRAVPVERLSSRPGVTEVWLSKKDKTGMYHWLLPAQREC